MHLNILLRVVAVRSSQIHLRVNCILVLNILLLATISIKIKNDRHSFVRSFVSTNSINRNDDDALCAIFKWFVCLLGRISNRSKTASTFLCSWQITISYQAFKNRHLLNWLCKRLQMPLQLANDYLLPRLLEWTFYELNICLKYWSQETLWNENRLEMVKTRNVLQYQLACKYRTDPFSASFLYLRNFCTFSKK